MLRALALALVVSSPLATLASAAADPFSRCETLIAERPDAYESARCFYDVARTQILAAAAQRRIEAHLERAPENPWLHDALASTLFLQRRTDPRIETHYVAAIRRLEESGRETEAVRTLGPLSRYYTLSNEPARAAAAVERASDLALRSGDPELQAFALFYRARHQRASGSGLLAAQTSLRRLEEMFLSGTVAHPRLQLLLYSSLSSTAYDLDRLREARRYRERHLELAEEMGERRSAANARLNLAALFIAEAEPDEANRNTALRLAREALAAARETRAVAWEAQAHHLLGMLEDGERARAHLRSCIRLTEGNRPGMGSLCRARLARLLAEDAPEEAISELRRSLAVLQQTSNPWVVLYGLEDRLSAARALLPAAASEALQERALLALQALRAAQSAESGRSELMSAWTSVHDLIVGQRLAALTSITAPGGGPAPPSRLYPPGDQLEVAFRATEQRRARVLFEKIEAGSRPADPAVEAARAELSALQQRQFLLHLLLASPRTQGSRTELRSRLQELGFAGEDLDELIEQPARSGWPGWRQRLARRADELRQTLSQAPALPLDAEIPALQEVIDALRPNEALLLYHLGWWRDIYRDFAGGSWLLAISKDGLRAYPLPDVGEVESAVEMVIRLEEPDRDAPAGLARLYRLLLEPALLDLPATVDHLVVVPDGRLNDLPFDGLRPAKVALPLAHSHRVSLAPSATLWFRWRGLESSRAPVSAVVLADPLAGDAGRFWHRLVASSLTAIGLADPGRADGVSTAPAPWRDLVSFLAPYLERGPSRGGSATAAHWPLDAFLAPDDPDRWFTAALFPWMVPRQRSLGSALFEPLPGAREEALSIARILDGEVHLLLGDEASEERLETQDLRRTKILHLATHALIDPEEPDHLAVVLATSGREAAGPGAGTEGQQKHGLLTVHEIEELDLDGTLVVLSTCQSAAGALTRGEGVSSLARAFFSAGAHAVVASLKPLDDRQAVFLFTEFYRRLAAGESAGEALGEVKRLSIRDGVPFSTWANVVVMGKDDLRPFPTRAAR